MRGVDVIIKKRDKGELTLAEIEYFIKSFISGEVTDYQASALLMAIVLNGMTPRETTDLTLAMANSGHMLDLSDVVDLAVDKHSSGGVGDKTSLAVLPIVAACGLPVGKMSGRGLGFSGGTLDKLESIPGYRVDLTTEEFKHQLKEKGIVLTGQSLDLAPADGKLYALRDVTGTVQSIPLIASSIMCKKLAAGAQAILLDVKTGLGAFMETLDEARQLADLMVDIGQLAGREVVALLSDMNQPLGYAVGNSLEVIEAIETLQDNGPEDFLEHCLHVSAHMLVLGKRASDLSEGRTMAEKSIADGSAFEKFRVLVEAQGGDVSYVDDISKFPRAELVEVVESPQNGYVAQIQARSVGEAAVALGAGRARKSDPIDHAVGFIIPHKVGDLVEKGEPLFTIYANDQAKLTEARDAVLSAYAFSEESVERLPLFYE
ncbi:MAG TPA: thymidine phosphorylase [Anaerolineales bacterium]|nr:thymidine phosphorylase [Anaerolineales bacterium]